MRVLVCLLLMLLHGCASPEVRCEDHLQPINLLPSAGSGP